MNPRFWKGTKVLVTGGHGFLGHHLMPLLAKTGAVVTAPRKDSFDLRSAPDVDALFRRCRPQVVIHMAVHGGGIGHMRSHPGSIFYDNILMDTLVVDASRRYGVKKFVGIGTVCSYPKFTPVPFCEKDLWNGYPEETNAPYGLAKKMMLVQTQGYRQEYGLNGIHLLMTNMYGPYDHFDARVSHVIPALIIKFADAVRSGSREVVAWGTGRVSREFLYAGDGARAILLAAERYNGPEPVNVGSGREVSVKILARTIAKQMGYSGKIVWDPRRPDGQPKRRLDTRAARKAFGFKSTVSLEDGLKRTITWYLDSIGS